MSASQDVLLVVHLCAWAQLGTLVRIYLGKLFGGSCQEGGDGPWYWVPCVTSDGLTRYGGALFQDLPANVAGSFVIGLLSTSDTLAAVFHDPTIKGSPAAFLPAHSPLQGHAPILIGLRTGFCGSLTTFSSWIMQMTEMMVGGAPSPFGTEWVAALWGLFIGTSVAVTALYMGQQLAVALFLVHARRSAGPPAVRTEVPGAAAAAAPAVGAAAAAPPAPSSSSADKAAPAPDVGPAPTPRVSAAGDPISSLQVVLSPEPGIQTAATPPPRKAPSWQCWLTDMAAVVVLITLTGVSIALCIVQDDEPHELGMRYFWFSILMGPFGCLLRWQLAKLNGALPGPAAWFPLGTFTANMLAVAIDDGLQVLIKRVALTPLQGTVVLAVQTGFSGCLSTVSTWIVEVQKLDLGYPGHARGYQYAAASLLGGILLGLAIYGTGIWTM